MEGKQLGKIKNFSIGLHDYGFGALIELGGDCWGVGDSKLHAEKWEEHYRYSREQWLEMVAEVNAFIGKTLKDAKQTDVRKLVGVPVEVTFDGNLMKSWRVLTEVL